MEKQRICCGGVFGDNSGIIFFLISPKNIHCGYLLEESASVAQLDARPTGYQEVAGPTPT